MIRKSRQGCCGTTESVRIHNDEDHHMTNQELEELSTFHDLPTTATRQKMLDDREIWLIEDEKSCSDSKQNLRVLQDELLVLQEKDCLCCDEQALVLASRNAEHRTQNDMDIVNKNARESEVAVEKQKEVVEAATWEYLITVINVKNCRCIIAAMKEGISK